MGCNTPGINYHMPPGFNNLVKAIQSSWSIETAQPHDGEWSESNPSKGQCCVTALVLLDHYPGSIARGTVLDEGVEIIHYWAVTMIGELDICANQFTAPRYLSYTVNPDRNLYWFKDTEQKYNLLKNRVEKILNA